MGAVHWPSREWWNIGSPRCGAPSDRPMSTDPGEVTCKSCEKHVEADLESPEEHVERVAYQKARNRARSRAVTELVERHGGEFEELWEEHTRALLDGMRLEVRVELEREARWEEERLARRRAELESELAKLERERAALGGE